MFRSGVALPNNNGHLFTCAINDAISFASYLGVDSDLYELSCSSSIIIIPILSKGANIADLAPITILIFPFSYFLPFIMSFSY